jgi:hypothetical protein
VRKLKIFFLASAVVGFFSLIGCSKSSNNNSSSNSDPIYYSAWITIAEQPTNPGDTIFAETISAPKVTSAIVNNGAVLGYLGQPGSPSAGDTTVESGVDFGLYSDFTVGSIDLVSFGLDFSTSNSGLLYRYVIIPGTTLTTKGLTPMEVRSLSYAEVTKIFGSPAKQTATPTIQ